jgi:hypothetical protein
LHEDGAAALLASESSLGGSDDAKPIGDHPNRCWWWLTLSDGNGVFDSGEFGCSEVCLR